jgi:hypothetical protein
MEGRVQALPFTLGKVGDVSEEEHLTAMTVTLAGILRQLGSYGKRPG